MTNPTGKANAVQYAENVLQVHTPWNDAQDALDKIDKGAVEIDRLRASIRSYKQRIEDRKMEVTADAPSALGYPADGVQKQRDFVKLLLSNDEPLSDLESTLDGETRKLDEAMSKQRVQESRLHACTARMNELGGLLQFYAVAKSVESLPPAGAPDAATESGAAPAPPRTPFSS